MAETIGNMFTGVEQHGNSWSVVMRRGGKKTRTSGFASKYIAAFARDLFILRAQWTRRPKLHYSATHYNGALAAIQKVHSRLNIAHVALLFIAQLP